MKKASSPDFNLKVALNRLMIHKPHTDPPSRKELKHKIKNIIESNRELNHRFMDFNFAKEYKQMRRTMNQFNSVQNKKKKLVSKLSKENYYFTKSYSNIIASLVLKIDNSGITYNTISHFNKKTENYVPSKEKNFFYEDPLLLTKSKDLDTFYINENNPNSRKDPSLNYSKKLLLGLNSNSPLNRVLKVIERHGKKKAHNNYFGDGENISVSERQNISSKSSKNTTLEKKPLSDRDKNFFRNHTLLSNKFIDPKKLKEYNEIHMLKAYNNSIKRMINAKAPNRKQTQKIVNIEKLSSLLNQNRRKSINFDKSDLPKNDLRKSSRNVKFKTIFSSKNVLIDMPKKLEDIKPTKKHFSRNYQEMSDFIKAGFDTRQNNMQKSFKKKLAKMKKLKGSIQIQSIYNDFLKTKDTVHQYELKKEPKLKYLYSLFSDNHFMSFQKQEQQNLRIRKLDHDLFWTINEFNNK
jgi:hypothetical protein